MAVPIFGGHAEKVVAKATHVFPLPDGVDLVEAAAVPVAFLTAWYACARAEVAEGDRVVVTAAAGGVGSALLQVLREKRARAIALVGSEAKVAACRALGAADVGTYEAADELIERAAAAASTWSWTRSAAGSSAGSGGGSARRAATCCTGSPRPPAPRAWRS